MDYKVPKGSTVDEWEGRLPQPQRDIVRGLRTEVRRTVPGAREVVKWGWPWYEGNGRVAAILVFNGHVNLQVARGAQLEDPEGLLEGTSKDMRFLKVRTVADLGRLPIERLLREAAEVDAGRE